MSKKWYDIHFKKDLYHAILNMQKVNSTLGFLCLCKGAYNGYQEYRETEKNIKSKLNVRNLSYERTLKRKNR